MKTLSLIALLAMLLSACGEREQTLGTTPKSDGKPWQAPATAHTAKGWNNGDKAIWEAQLRARAQTQNEYAKVN